MTQPAAISPNGEFLAMVVIRSDHTQLWLRRMDSRDAQPLAGTEGAANPFWSPDSRYIGFFADGKLKKLDVSGGVVSNICPAGIFNMGGAWSSRGIILFSVLPGKLQRVADGGGAPEPIPGIEFAKDAFGPFWPSFLPDGKNFLFVEWRYPSPSVKDNFVWIGSLDGEKPRRLPITFTNAEYSGGHLLFNRDRDLLAQPFDLKHLELRGRAHPVAHNVQYDTFFDNAAFTVSRDGILVFAPEGTGVNSELTWMDRAGKTLGVLGEPDQFEAQAISPDGAHIAVGVKPAGSRENIWIYDVQRGTRVPLDAKVIGPALFQPRWSPDGKQLAYRTTVGGKTSVMYVRASDGSGDTQQVGREVEGVLTVEDWSPDGRYLAYVLTKFLGPDNWKNSLQVIPVTRDARPVFEIQDAGDARFSPDGKWLAYSDDTTGQVYVTRFPGVAGHIAVTSSGGSDPRWRADGQELFYVSNDQMLFSVQVRETAQDFRVLSSRPLFQIGAKDVAFYDVTRDGKRFLVNIRTHKEESEPLIVDTNWLSSLQTQ